MDLSGTQLIVPVFAGGGEMGARMRALDWSTTVLGQWSTGRNRSAPVYCIVPGSGHPMLSSRGPDYTMLYNTTMGTGQ